MPRIFLATLAALRSLNVVALSRIDKSCGMIAFSCATVSAILTGCALPSRINADAVAYNSVIEETTDRLLVINVLRARDKAPLHFADVPRINETVQETASITATLPFGPNSLTGSQRNLLGSTLSVQASPSFEIDQVFSKEFVTGIASPLDPKWVKYWLDRGIDRRVVLLLFVSAVEISGDVGDPVCEDGPEPGADGKCKDGKAPVAPRHVIHIKNSPREAIPIVIKLWNVHLSEPIGKCAVDPSGLDEEIQADFGRFLTLINSFGAFFAESYKDGPKTLTSDLRLPRHDALRQIAAIDPSKFQLTANIDPITKKPNGTYSLSVLSSDQKTAFCYAPKRKLGENASASPTQLLRWLPEQFDPTHSRADDRCSSQKQNPTITCDPRAALPPSAKSQVRVPYKENQRGYCDLFTEFLTPSCHAEKPRNVTITFAIRSTGEIFQFLGDLLEYQRVLRKSRTSPDPFHNVPVTLSFCYNKRDWDPKLGWHCPIKDEERKNCHCNEDDFVVDEEGVLFQVDEIDTSISNVPTPRLVVPYRNSFYSVAEFSPNDHSLEVLAILHQLVNLNRSATDIKPTPFVQVLP